MERKNSGFTLVELVLSMAILAVAGLGIGSFLYISIRQYQTATTQAELQTQAQMVQNQMQNLILETNRGIYIEPDAEDAYQNGEKISFFSEKPDGCEKIVISFVEKDQTLYYTKYKLQEVEDAVTGKVREWVVEEDANGEVFANAVTKFAIELCDAQGNLLKADVLEPEIDILNIEISYQINQTHYSSKFQTAARNKLTISEDELKLFGLTE